MEFWSRQKNAPETVTPKAPEVPVPVPVEEPLPELLLTREFKADFEHISSSDEFIAAIDFDTLNSIFDSLVDRSSGTSGVRNTGFKIDPEKIRFISRQSNSEGKPSLNGQAFIFKGEIEIAWDFSEGKSLPPEKAIDLLRTLTHESTHIRSGASSKTWEVGTGIDDWVGYFQFKDGLSSREVRRSLFDRSEKEFGLLLNEAITENIGQEVLREYLIRTGNSGYLNDAITLDCLGSGSYGVERLAFACVLSALSEQLEVPVDELWKGFVQAYMNGNHELMALVDDMSEIISSDPGANELLRILVLDADHTLTVESVLDKGIYMPELPKDDEGYAWERLKVINQRLLALGKQIAALKALEFKSKVIGDALGIRNQLRT